MAFVAGEPGSHLDDHLGPARTRGQDKQRLLTEDATLRHGQMRNGLLGRCKLIVKQLGHPFMVALARLAANEVHGVSATGLQPDSPFELRWEISGFQCLPTIRISPHRSLGTFHPQAMARTIDNVDCQHRHILGL